MTRVRITQPPQTQNSPHVTHRGDTLAAGDGTRTGTPSMLELGFCISRHDPRLLHLDGAPDCRNEASGFILGRQRVGPTSHAVADRPSAPDLMPRVKRSSQTNAGGAVQCVTASQVHSEGRRPPEVASLVESLQVRSFSPNARSIRVSQVLCTPTRHDRTQPRSLRAACPPVHQAACGPRTILVRCLLRMRTRIPQKPRQIFPIHRCAQRAR